MARIEKLLHTIVFGKCEVHYTKCQYRFCTTIILYKTRDSWGRAIFCRMATILNKLVKCPLAVVVPAKNIPFMFPYIGLSKTRDTGPVDFFILARGII